MFRPCFAVSKPDLKLTNLTSQRNNLTHRPQVEDALAVSMLRTLLSGAQAMLLFLGASAPLQAAFGKPAGTLVEGIRAIMLRAELGVIS